jgi:formate hydrogenlyase transcriptional activator
MEGLFQTWSAIVASGQEGEIQARMRRFDGEYKWFLFRVAPLRDHMGSLVGWLGVDVEIDERKRSQDQLRRSESYLAEAQKLSHTGSFGWKVSTGEIYWSEETFRILGCDRSITPTLDLVLERVHPEDAAAVKQALEQSSNFGKDFDLEHRLLMPNGAVKHLRAVGRAMKDRSGSLEFAGAVMDTTAAKQAEEKLRQFSGGLLQLLNTIPALIHTGLADGDLDFFNQTWLQYVGLSLEEIQGWKWTGSIHPDDLEGIVERWRASLSSGEPFLYEARVRRSDGEYRWMLHHKIAARDNDGKIVKWYGSSIDIEDRKRAEAEVRSSEAQFQLALDTIPGLVWSALPDGYVDYLNQRWQDFTGCPLSEARGWGWQVAIHPDDLAGHVEYWKSVLASGQPGATEVRMRRFDGVYRWHLARGVPLYEKTGKLLKWYGQNIDIHERKCAEEQIRVQEIELRQALDLAPQHVAVLGPDGVRLSLNQAGLDYFGLTLDVWRSCDPDKLVHPDDRGRMSCLLQALSPHGPAQEEEVRLLRKDGKYRWFLLRLNAVRDEQGRIARWYVAATDIEDRKQAEERLQHENIALREEIDKASMYEEIVGTSVALQAVLSRVSKVAPTDSTVLITGETGTGKELVARAIHRRSHRSSRAFISVNCAAIPRDLIASELFGHEKGAFTGAMQRRVGRFELAGGGTIFLDEIGELPPETQISLLRVLQEHEFERVGGNRSFQTDVRVIAATNRDLPAAIAAGTFRSDLFYRLNVFPIEVPALRQRAEDLPMLVEYFLDRYGRKAGKNIQRVAKKTMELLQSYPWPGNIRELQNVVERSVILCETEDFSIDESWLSRKPSVPVLKNAQEINRDLALHEREMIEAALRACGGRVFGPSGAAAKLGMPRSTLESKIRSLKINKNQFKK